MSSATMLKSSTFRPATTVQSRRTSQPRRVGPLRIVAVTNWQLEPKGGKASFMDLTESIAGKSTATVKSSGGDFVSLACLLAKVVEVCAIMLHVQRSLVNQLITEKLD